MAKAQKPDLVALVHIVQGLVNGLPPFNWQRPEPHHEAEQAIVARLRDAGARFINRDGVTITFGGVRSSSTGGTTAALKNWIGAARRKLDQQAIARMSK